MSEKYDFEDLQSKEELLKAEISKLRNEHKRPTHWIILTAIFGGLAMVFLMLGLTFLSQSSTTQSAYGISYVEVNESYKTASTALLVVFAVFAAAALIFLFLLLKTVNENKPINEKISAKENELQEIQRKMSYSIRRSEAPEEQKPTKQPKANTVDPRNISSTGDALVFQGLDGAQRILDVYEDRVVLTQKKNIRAFLTHDLLKGTKEIYFADMSSVQFKKASSLILGYIQFEVAGLAGNNFGSENSWTYESYRQEEADKAVAYIKGRLSEMKKQKAGGGNTQVVQQVSAADEIKKYKDLFDQGIITEEEYNKKKKELLGL